MANAAARGLFLPFVTRLLIKFPKKIFFPPPKRSDIKNIPKEGIKTNVKPPAIPGRLRAK